MSIDQLFGVLWPLDWESLASVATAIGVWQIRQNSMPNQAQFEDSFDQQYRALAMEIPVDVLIGKTVTGEQEQRTREAIYNYLDLSNEQVFLRKRKRVREDTWKDWCAGIKANLGKPAFMIIWKEIKKESPGTFSFLESLEQSNFEDDPVRW